MIKPILFCMLTILALAGCKNETVQTEEMDIDCSSVSCVYRPLVLKVKFIDKTTGKNLVSGPDAVYSIDDVQVISDFSESDYEPIVRIDSTDNQIVVLESIQSGDMIKLGALPTDKFTIAFAKAKECCERPQITNISINDQRICGPCGAPDERIIEIKK